MSELERLVRRLREEPGLSRNRHFDELSSPVARRARRLLRRLQGLSRELSEGASIAVRAEDGGYRVVIDLPQIRARREAFLTVEEHALLFDEELLRRLRARAA